ncbi:hypothetical protein A0H81_02131 [Grifola frondosa]|uniref:Uncharacterized protein n=1 Tax=Grifola frondosa TaxID=5627 RepID=A0A1C7MM31_GRIFR|nr:hypothetical protein A0H81_02131 [Grifola frondosa]
MMGLSKTRSDQSPELRMSRHTATCFSNVRWQKTCGRHLYTFTSTAILFVRCGEGVPVPFHLITQLPDMSSTTFPVEVFEHIIDAVAEQDAACVDKDDEDENLLEIKRTLPEEASAFTQFTAS